MAPFQNVSCVITKTRSGRFQINPVWRVFWKSSIFKMPAMSNFSSLKSARFDFEKICFSDGLKLGLIFPRHSVTGLNILVPEAALLFASIKNRDLWKGPTPKVRRIHGLPVNLRMLKDKADNLIGWDYETIILRMLGKLDLPRSPWC